MNHHYGQNDQSLGLLDMETENSRDRNVDWSRFGLGAESAPRARANTSGFVDLGNEYEFGAGGHQASGANELFAEEQV